MSSVMLSAGDASGEAHAADFVQELLKRLPGVHCFGLGGTEMKEAGVQLLVNQRELAIGGIFELLGDVGRVWRAWRAMIRGLSNRPDLLVLVDSPDFNLPLARRARKLGVPVLYYISPQVWVWRRYRIRKIARRVDRMCVIFPFECDVYAGTDLRVDFVGHPLVDRLAPLRIPEARSRARESLGWPADRPLVALFPGSRRNEIETGLPLQLETARAVLRRCPEVGFGVGLAPSISRAQVDGILHSDVKNEVLKISVFESATYDLALAANVALAKPGTITLELATLGTPMVVAFRGNRASLAVARWLSYVDSSALPNLIARKKIVPEFIQNEAQPDLIAAALERLLEGPAAEKQCRGLVEVAEVLGEGGAARRAAAVAEEMVGGSARS